MPVLKPHFRTLSFFLAGLCALTGAYPQVPANPPPAAHIQPGALENALIRSATGSKAYLVRGGKKHWILSADWVPSHGYNWADLKVLENAELNAIPTGDPIGEDGPAAGTARPQSAWEGKLVFAEEGGRLYLVHNGVRRWITDPHWLSASPYAGRTPVLVSKQQLASIPEGAAIDGSAPVAEAQGQRSQWEGKLVYTPEEGRLYLVRNGYRHWITDARWLSDSPYAAQSPTQLPEAELAAIPVGSFLTYTPFAAKVLLGSLTLFLWISFATATKKPLWAVVQTLGHRLTPERLRDGWTRRHWQGVLFLVVVAAIIVREPYLLRYPRFWAEEGSVWFQYAIKHSAIQTLFYIYPKSGYLNLLANVGAVISSFAAAALGLEYAPLATTVVALSVQLIAIALITFGKSCLFDSTWKRAAGCLIVLFAPTATDEIWLNTINSMSYLGLITLLLLFEQLWLWPKWLKRTSYGLLILAGLSAIYSIALLPLFMLGARVYQKQETRIQVLILMACALVQGGCLVHSKLAAGGLPSRGADVRWDASMVNVAVGHVAIPSCGVTTTQNLLGTLGLTDAWIAASSYPRPASETLVVAGWFCFTMLLLVLWHLRGPGIGSQRSMVLGAFLMFSTLTCLGSLHSIPQGRYAFLPGLAFLLLLLENIDAKRTRLAGHLCMLVLSYGLANGMVAYRKPPDPAAPQWSREVRTWRRDHAYRMRVWPSWWGREPGQTIVYTGSKGD